ncbi:MAG: protein kinase [Pirellulaceae bacterium]|nr:protein kinase [Pirellulaceae bacterium]
MNIRKNPAKAPSTDAPPAEETLAMSNSVTEEDIDGFVREALAGKAVPPDTQEDVQELLERLADLDLIRQLAGEAHPLVSIGPFEFLEEIGRGGMGAVYKARHRELGKIQAVKVIHTDMKSNSELLARFRREVRAIGALSHPNIIAAHHADIENGSPYLVMDFVDGDSLSNIQKQLKASGQQFSVASACEAVRQAALGIQYAHEQAITHRDIKPGNLVLDRHGVVRVLDLGLAQLHAPEGDTQVTELTRGDQILGTPDFMSPEQLRSPRSVDTRTDVYSLGATLYVLLTGSTPYPSEQDEGFVAKANRILNAPVPDGAVRKFHPSGRQLAAAEWPQPLAPASATFNAQGLLTAVHAANVTDCALSIWNADGTANDYVKLAQSLLVNSTEVCWNARTQQILMRDVNGVGRIFDMQGNEVRTLAGLRIGNPMWSPADDRFAVIRYAEQSGQILLFSDGDEPIWTSPAFVPFIPPPTWSPDGRWLAWVTHEPATDKHRLHVLDVADEAKTVHEFSLIEQGVDRCISISPDSQWLVTIRQDPREPQARGEVLALHLPTLKEYRQLVSVNGLLARKVVWADDSQTFAAGAVMRVSPQKGLERLGSLSLSGLPESFVQLQSGKLLSCQDGIGKQYTFDGESNAEFGITTPALSGHADPYQANLTSGSRVVFMAAGRVSQKQTTVGEFDRSLPAVRWTGIAFDDGQRLSFNAAGALLSAPEDYDRYLAHSLRYPGGRTVAVTREELHRRIAATPTEKALLWAMDLFADMRDDNSATWSLADPIDVDALPAIDSIRYLDLHDAKEIADQELSYLPQFNGLSQLNLSDTEISMLPDLSSLKGLQALDLSGTKLQSIDGLQGLSALKQLDLSRTEISLTEESIEILASLSALEQLNLNDARTQAFVPLRLAGLKNLRQLSLIGVDLPADELRQLQQDLPECEFLIDEKDRGRSQLSNTAD